jgi:hypothetical protein
MCTSQLLATGTGAELILRSNSTCPKLQPVNCPVCEQCKTCPDPEPPTVVNVSGEPTVIEVGKGSGSGSTSPASCVTQAVDDEVLQEKLAGMGWNETSWIAVGEREVTAFSGKRRRGELSCGYLEGARTDRRTPCLPGCARGEGEGGGSPISRGLARVPCVAAEDTIHLVGHGLEGPSKKFYNVR